MDKGLLSNHLMLCKLSSCQLRSLVLSINSTEKTICTTVNKDVRSKSTKKAFHHVIYIRNTLDFLVQFSQITQKEAIIKDISSDFELDRHDLISLS